MNRPPVHFAPQLVTAPAEMPVTLEQAKAYCRSAAGDDDLIDGALRAAVAAVDGPHGSLGRCLMQQTWRQPFACFAEHMPLPFPAVDLSEVSYRGTDGLMHIADIATYRLEDATGAPYVALNEGSAWPPVSTAGGAVVFVTFVAGFPGDVPPPIKQAILLDVRRAYGVLKADADLKKDVVEGVGSKEWDVSGSLDSKLADIIARMLAPYRRINL